jgi:hypothetical protein
MGHGSPRLDRVGGRSRDWLSERNHHTTESSTRRESGVLAGRCVCYPPRSTSLPPPDSIVPTELVNSRIVPSWNLTHSLLVGGDSF